MSHQIPLESISNPAIHRGTPEGVSFTVEGAPLLGFLDILGLAPSSFTIYSIMVAESYLRISHYSPGLQEKILFDKFKLR